MTREEAKRELQAMRPNKPWKTEGRKKQMAIDVAIATIDCYEDLLTLITQKGYPTE
jgi:hypothetical protein